MNNEYIFVKGARVHNLKNIDIKIPRGKLVVITGLSGSGKSSLAFDTIYAEGQRRYVESLSSYARQFLELMDKPDVDFIEGLSPAIAIDQKAITHNPRSTVGTMTEIYDYLRLLFARIGIPHCPECGREIKKQTPQEIVDQILTLPKETKIIILSPVIIGRKGEYKNLLEKIKKDGFFRVRIDKTIYTLEEEIEIDKNKKHDIEIVIDRIVLKEDIKNRLTESIELALKYSDGLVKIILVDSNEERIFSSRFACPVCGISLPEIEPRLFSFNSPFGACPTCQGLGFKMEVDPDLIIPDKSLSISEGAIKAPGYQSLDGFNYEIIESLSNYYDFDLDTPIYKIDKKALDILLYGTDGRFKVNYTGRDGEEHHFYTYWEGIINAIQRRYKETESNEMKEFYEKFMRFLPCPDCGGKRLKKEALSVLINGKNIYEVTDMNILDCLNFFENINLTETEKIISKQILKEIQSRLKFLVDVGLSYLTLNRESRTLSGGEGQRIRLATQIGSGLTGVLYVLDEPTIGLHNKDTKKLLNSLKRLRDLGNTLIVVEHDELVIRESDYIIDMGPGAGENGGEIVFEGKVDEIIKSDKSLTGKYLSNRLKIEIPYKRRKGNGKYFEIIGAEEHNLKNIDVKIPLNTFTCITGVSGSGKSTLIYDILYKGLKGIFFKSGEKPGLFKEFKGIENIDKVVMVDQSPIGRTPRSNPATYINLFTPIRELFSKTKEARERGYTPGRFSFNVFGGRCEACEGAGVKRIEMQFLPDVYVTCEVCHGKRYNRETLEITWKGKNISDVLNMTVDEAYEFFENIPSIKRKLSLLKDVGLGYIKLGQPAPTLSGGEAQRVKLSYELSKSFEGHILYLLDEPTTGLHFDDVKKLLNVLNRLVEKGNTVIVIEHHPDIIKSCDYIIDLGPEGGDEGGYVVAQGTPEEISNNKKSYTGELLKKILNR
ncbi:MAG TPA: excinuclease ABC subunit UvrA [Caldisericia bacterium]|nr:excinuclease ABC subunit UvrA [Caldisericia bacterium]HPB33556.1 excinuclease ABC subunit UvrA [Caldisericia bacterium]HQL65968.1 excinuclease ABC subunit UvrA [Caldisericia bacterium]HQN48535.1 excinuclease ABC subunit UvrA [Caldisericia bacterium]HQP00334.1 excinuclease ABC subunit UvrA [Caldisericia bacterium]